jgi:hypothetical protein
MMEDMGSRKTNEEKVISCVIFVSQRSNIAEVKHHVLLK